MRVCAVLVAVVGACADDPSLHVEVKHPDGVTVASTVVSVYESGTIRCEAVEFGDLTADQLQGALVAEETLYDVAPPQGSLANLSRTDPKIIVARGFGADGKLLTAGCAEQDVVSGHVTITVTTELAATASLQLVDPTHAMDAYGLAITTTDPSGKEIDGRPVSWRVWGPSGAMPATTTGVTVEADGAWVPAAPSCTQNGVAKIHPVPPALVGGYAVQPRVAWAADATPMYSALLANLDVTGTPLTPPATDIPHLCAIGVTAGAPRLVCITGSGTTTYSVSATGALTAMGSATLASPAIGVVAMPAGSDVAVYAVTSAASVTQVFPTQKPAVACTGTLCAGAALDDVIAVPACGTSPARVLVHSKALAATNQLRWLDTTTGALADFPVVTRTATEAAATLGLASAGCASELDAAKGTFTTQQLIAIDYARLGGAPIVTRGHFACAASCSTIELPVAGAGVGFTGGMEPTVVGTAIDATGVVIATWLMSKTATGDRWLELSRQPAASVPRTIVTGQLDDDGAVDKLWDIKTKGGSLVQVAYARQAGTDPLSALTFALQQQEPPVALLGLMIGDTTGDGFDDVVLVGQTVETAPKTGVAVLPTRAKATLASLMTDATCAP